LIDYLGIFLVCSFIGVGLYAAFLINKIEKLEEIQK